MDKKTLSNHERTYLSLAVITIGVILIYAADAVGQALSSRHPALGSIGTLTTYALSAMLVLWGLVIVCQTRVSFQLDGDILHVCRKTTCKYHIFPIEISKIAELRAEKSQVVIVLTSGATVGCRKPFSEHSHEVLSTVSSIISNRNQSTEPRLV